MKCTTQGTSRGPVLPAGVTDADKYVLNTAGFVLHCSCIPDPEIFSARARSLLNPGQGLRGRDSRQSYVRIFAEKHPATRELRLE
ncbi:uncharacterized [Tachysurus ichikawai]